MEERGKSGATQRVEMECELFATALVLSEPSSDLFNSSNNPILQIGFIGKHHSVFNIPVLSMRTNTPLFSFPF